MADPESVAVAMGEAVALNAVGDFPDLGSFNAKCDRPQIPYSTMGVNMPKPLRILAGSGLGGSIQLSQRSLAGRQNADSIKGQNVL